MKPLLQLLPPHYWTNCKQDRCGICCCSSSGAAAFVLVTLTAGVVAASLVVSADGAIPCRRDSAEGALVQHAFEID
eukprot:13760576-Alexandrium_andersonii.AAC.1